ncbi:Isochorismatase-like protein [Aspergillus undulatus]|uniref:Isochorismatase-like protein n=1 Tax=Aspergillus undulatus TaxID=1810928 RepID=UPI003CCC9E3E
MGWGGRPALLLIDVCKAYWTPGSPLSLLGNPAAEEAPDSRPGLKVEYFRPDTADAGLFWLKSKSLDVWRNGDMRGLDYCMGELNPSQDDVVISKKYASAFFGTTLSTELQTLNIDTLVIGGVSTSGCVRATALNAMQNGFRPMVCLPLQLQGILSRVG